MITVTVTDHTMTVLATGELDHSDWMRIIYEHNLQDRVMDVVDYTIEDYDAEVPVQTWRIEFANVNTKVR